MADAAATAATGAPEKSKKTAPMELTPEAAAESMLPNVTPQELLAAVETPGAFKEIAKADLFMEMARLRRLFKSGSISLADRLKYLQLLSRMAGVDTAPADDGSQAGVANMPQINIVINGQQAIQPIVSKN